jgi:hypothetical protein
MNADTAKHGRGFGHHFYGVSRCVKTARHKEEQLRPARFITRDEDARNNEEGNLTALCRGCHEIRHGRNRKLNYAG